MDTVKTAYIDGFTSELRRHGLEKRAAFFSLLTPIAGGLFNGLDAGLRFSLPCIGKATTTLGKGMSFIPKLITKPLSWYGKGVGKLMTGGPINNKLLNSVGLKMLKPHPLLGLTAVAAPAIAGAMWLRNRNEKLQQVDTMTPTQEKRWERKTKGGYYDLGYDLEDDNNIPSLAY